MTVRETFEKLLTFIRSRLIFALAWCACVSVSLNATPGWADLQEYVRKPETEFEWKLKNKIDQSGDRIYDLEFVSQVWQEGKWRHKLQIYSRRAPRRTRRC